MTDNALSLFAIPSATEGLARMLDFADTMTAYNTESTPAEADRIAALCDWYAIGDDIRDAMFGEHLATR